MRKKSLGNLGENLGLKYLQNNGYQFIERNFRSKFGEIDLIFLDGQTLVFVEVKTRLSETFGSPEEAVNQLKLRSIIKTAQFYLLFHHQESISWRIDLMAVDLKKKTITHYQNITL